MFVLLDIGAAAEGLVAIAGSIGTALGALVLLVKGYRKAMDEKMDSVPPSPEQPPPPSTPFGTPPPTDPFLAVRVLEANTAVARADTALAELRRQMDALAADGRKKGAAIASLQKQLSAANAKAQTAEAAAEHWRGEVARLTQELAEGRPTGRPPR